MLRTTRLLAPVTRRAPIFQHRMQSTYQPPEAPKTEETPKSNPHRDFYKYRSRPVFKAALIAIFTYEILYWGWLKLESIETKHDVEGEIKSLENELRHLTKDKTEAST
ncbi:hypothetical protein Q7P36_009069 [Cladosporium allicinum]